MASNVRNFLISNGLIQPHEVPNGQGEFRITCPSCHHAGTKCYVNGNGRGILCFHCKFRLTQRAFERRYEPPTPQETAMEQYVSTCHAALINDPAMMQWFEDRGMPADVVKAQRFGLHDANMYAPGPVDDELGLTWPNGNKGWMFQGRIIIPYVRDGVIITVRGRRHPDVSETIEKQKYMSLTGAKGELYFPSSLDPELPVVICEGEFDSVLLRLNGVQAVGVPGSNAAKKEYFHGFRHLYVAFDGDDAGREGGDKLLKSIDEIRRIEMPEGFDISDYILDFGMDSFRHLMDKAVLYLHGRPQKEDRFSNIVEDYSNWAWTNGQLLGPKMAWAPRFEKMMSGWAPGLCLIGAEAHSGKSCFMVKALYELCLDNPDDTIGVYLSLDDTVQEAMTRMLSLHSGIDFNEIRIPRFSFVNKPELLQHYTDSVDSLKKIENLILRDATYGRSLNYLRSFFRSLRTKYPEKKIVVFIDSLAKITADGGDDEDQSGDMATKGNWKAYLAAELKYLTTRHNICVVTPTDLRKLNGARRPTRDDLKDASELAYEANTILLCYNDLKRMRDEAVLTWVYPETNETEAVFEIINDKNKVTGKTGVIRFHMHGGTSNFWECTDNEDAAFSEMTANQLADKRRKEAS